MLCLCPSVTQTPILAGCTATELADMRREVGGFMEPDQVAAAFIQLLQTGHSGAVMAVWKETAPISTAGSWQRCKVKILQ